MAKQNITALDFNQITKEVFDNRTKNLGMKWEDFKTEDDSLDLNEAWQCFIQDVWDAKYKYVDPEDDEKWVEWETGYHNYFYEAEKVAPDQALSNNRSVTYNQAAIDEFIQLFDEHIEALELAETKPEDTRSVSELIKSKDYKALSEHMKTGVKDYLNSDTYKNYLAMCSHFHSYSSGNIRMILEQNPDAQQVASFNKWTKELERKVNKGAKAIYIYAPIQVKIKDKDGTPILNEEGEEEKRQSFKLVPVFDVSQTSGEELPRPIYELEGGVKDYDRLFDAIVDSLTAPVSFEEIKSGARGYYSPSEHKIVLNSGMSEEQTIKTLIHEGTHSELHTNSKASYGDETYTRQEFEAESVAYVVSEHYGVDTSSYSFAYLGVWGMDKLDLEQLEATMKKVQEESNKLIQNIDKSLELSLENLKENSNEIENNNEEELEM